MGATRIASARPLIAWASFLLTLICVAAAVFSMRANGLLLLASLFLAVCAWAVGMFSRAWWARYDTPSRHDAGTTERTDR